MAKNDELSKRTMGALERAGFSSVDDLWNHIEAHGLCSGDGGKTYQFPGIIERNAKLPPLSPIENYQHESIPMVGKVGWRQIIAALGEMGLDWQSHVQSYASVMDKVRDIRTNLRALARVKARAEVERIVAEDNKEATPDPPKPSRPICLSDEKMAKIQAEFPDPGPQPNLGFYRYIPTVDKPPKSKPHKWTVRVVAPGYSAAEQFEAETVRVGKGGSLIFLTNDRPVTILAPGTWVMVYDSTDEKESKDGL